MNTYSHLANNFFAVLVFLSAPTLLAAQLSPIFETAFYFEDSRGNRDTVYSGFDPRATGGYDRNFDGPIITAPFDSVFEVRVAEIFEHTFFEQTMTLRKRVISYAYHHDDRYGDDCYRETPGALFFIHARYPPVTVSWDAEVFRKSFCRVASIFEPHFQASYPGGPNPWWLTFPDQAALVTCMSEDSTAILNLPPRPWGEPLYPTDIQPTEGGQLDTIPIVRYSPLFEHDFQSPCRVEFVNTATPSQSAAFIAYPNPAATYLVISYEAVPYELYDAFSRLVLRGTASEVDVTSLAAGMYTLMIKNERPQRIVVQR